MELDDRTSIRTPEGLDLELTLAGLGSRFAAATLDGLIVGIMLILAAFAATAVGTLVGDDLSLLVAGIVSLSMLSILIVYYAGFEAWNDGRTPGKAAFGLRVISEFGEPVGFLASMVRNLLRVVDFLPAFYLVGMVSILASDRNQRLGDLAARTVVIRDRSASRPAVPLADLSQLSSASRWDVTAITAEEVALIQRFFERSRSLTRDRRQELAGHIAHRIRPRVGGVDADPDPETFLSRVLAEKLSPRNR